MFVQVYRANSKDYWHLCTADDILTNCGEHILPDWQSARLGEGRTDCINSPKTELCEICWFFLFKKT